MIEVLGISPISSVAKVGTSEFLSLLRSNPSKAFGGSGEYSSTYYRPYTSTRGILIDKEFLKGSTIDLNLGYRFQFNPQTIDDVKETLYESREYTGLSYNDYVWSGGGERLITFELFLDDTPQTHTINFRPLARGSKLADELKNNAKFGIDETGKAYNNERYYFGKSTIEELQSQARAITSSVVAKKPTSFEFVTNGAYSHKRIHKRGVLDDVEKIQSFLYPRVLTGETIPLFAEGGIVSKNQFRPPATVVLCVGPLYLEGIIKAAPVHYELFDEDLTPLRARINVEFAVFEFDNITRKINRND